MTEQNSYVSGISKTPLLGRTIGEQFDETVAAYPDNDALIVHHQDLRYTYKELQAAVDECARALMAMGVQAGERVGVWSPNNAQWCITQFATAKIGAILVNINPSYRTHEVEYALKHSGTSVLIIQGKFKTSDYVSMMTELVPALEKPLNGSIQSDRLPELRQVICLDEAHRSAGMLTWPELIARANETSADAFSERQQGLQFDDPINIQY
ncbi:MAG: AMP-binding protein, partial [Marinobacter sp.]|nr:AMP-binding protein [Marinobacter sp.]